MISKAPSGSEMASLYYFPWILTGPEIPPCSLPGQSHRRSPRLSIFSILPWFTLWLNSVRSPHCVCACVHVCVLNCSIKCGSFYRLPGFGDQQIRHSPVLKAAMWQTQNPHLDPVDSARRKGWAGWRRQWPQIIPCFPSITQSRGRMGGSKAKGNFPGNEKPLGLLRELGHRPT